MRRVVITISSKVYLKKLKRCWTRNVVGLYLTERDKRNNDWLGEVFECNAGHERVSLVLINSFCELAYGKEYRMMN